MSTTTTYTGVRIGDFPDLGAVNDNSSVVGEHAGSGLFSAPALRSYVLTSPVLLSLPTSPTGLPTGTVWNNGGVLCIVQ